jgi:uncharacterized membrane protein YgdD (TMEM256/DUF423 family)
MIWTFAGAVSAFLAVALGAFGAHALRGHVSDEILGIFETAVRWQLAHALALVALGLGAPRLVARDVRAVGALFVTGSAVFAGSLYAIVATGVRSWGMVTPVGGLLFLLGWAWLAWAALVARRAESRG